MGQLSCGNCSAGAPCLLLKGNKIVLAQVGMKGIFTYSWTGGECKPFSYDGCSDGGDLVSSHCSAVSPWGKLGQCGWGSSSVL